MSRDESGQTGKADEVGIDAATTETRGSSSFATTHWGMVHGARGDREQLDLLLRRYQPALLSYVRALGIAEAEAHDAVQDFIVRVLLGRDLLGRADPARGRFRSLLKTALRNEVHDRRRAERSRKKVQGNAPADGVFADLGGSTSEDVAEAAYDRAWAATVLSESMRRVERACRSASMETHWLAFERNVIGPASRGLVPMPLDQLAAELGVADAQTVSNMLQTVRRKVRRAMEDVVRETVAGGDAEVEEELRELRHVTAGVPAKRISDSVVSQRADLGSAAGTTAT